MELRAKLATANTSAHSNDDLAVSNGLCPATSQKWPPPTAASSPPPAARSMRSSLQVRTQHCQAETIPALALRFNRSSRGNHRETRNSFQWFCMVVRILHRSSYPLVDLPAETSM